MAETLELGGKTFTLRPWTLAQIVEIEDRLDKTLLQISSKVSELYVMLFVSIHGQHGITRFGEAAELVTMQNVRDVDKALAELLTQAVEERYSLNLALASEPEGEA